MHLYLGKGSIIFCRINKGGRLWVHENQLTRKPLD
jgi:hypothetical protein